MKSFIKRMEILGMVLSVVLPAARAADFDFASYTPTTIQRLIAEERDYSLVSAETNRAADCVQLECNVFKYRVLCGYSDIRRPISAWKKDVIRLWCEALRIDPEWASLYKQEIWVTEGSNAHWIPIQEKLVPHLRRELVKCDAIELFILFVGTAGSEFVFIATEFEKPVTPAGNLIQTAVTRLVAP
jgi:hypothetical protein